MFKRTKAKKYLAKFPTAVCVRLGDDHFYINKQFKHKITTKRILESWSFPFVLDATEESLRQYKNAKPLGFRPGTLVKAISDGKCYFIVSSGKMHVVNPDFIAASGVKPLFVSDAELKLHADAGVID